MASRTSFLTLRSQMSPEAQGRARAKSEALESEMALIRNHQAESCVTAEEMSGFGEDSVQTMGEAPVHAKTEGPAIVRAPVDPIRPKSGPEPD